MYVCVCPLLLSNCMNIIINKIQELDLASMGQRMHDLSSSHAFNHCSCSCSHYLLFLIETKINYHRVYIQVHTQCTYCNTTSTHSSVHTVTLPVHSDCNTTSVHIQFPSPSSCVCKFEFTSVQLVYKANTFL